MKALILTLVFLVSGVALAGQQCQTSFGEESVEDQLEIKTNVPTYLKGATIIVRLADGTESKVPAEKFKVVPRMQQFVVIKTKQVNMTTCQSDPDPAKNRVSILGGKGKAKGIDTSRDGSTLTIEERYGAVGGVQYQRLLTDRISVGGQVQTNDSVLLNIGLDF